MQPHFHVNGWAEGPWELRNPVPSILSVMAMFRQLIANMAQPGHPDCQRALRHAPPQQVGGVPGLS